MLTQITGLPDNVIGFEAGGRVTDADYKTRMIPALEKAIADKGKVRFLYVLGAAFDGYEPGAMWDDTFFGFKHLKDFEKVALVTDNAVYTGAMRLFSPMMPFETRVFPLAELEAAKTWLK